VILSDESWLLSRWSKSGAVLHKFLNVADKLIKNWEDFTAEFAENTATLKNTAAAVLVPMMHV